MKRTEFFKKVGLGIGALVVAPKVLVSSTAETPLDTDVGYDLSLPNTIDGYKPAFTPKRADFKRFKYESPWEKSI